MLLLQKVLTRGAVFSIEARSRAVALVLVKADAHANASVLTRVGTTRVGCSEKERTARSLHKKSFAEQLEGVKGTDPNRGREKAPSKEMDGSLGAASTLKNLLHSHNSLSGG